MAYSSGSISGPELTELRVSLIDDPEFRLMPGKKQMQNLCIFRTSYGITHEMMRMAKNKDSLLSMCQAEALENHIALINQNLMHSVKGVDYGIGGLPWRTMMGYVEMVDRGIDVSNGVKVVALKGRICKLVKFPRGIYSNAPCDWDYYRFEWVSELGLGLEGDGRKTQMVNLFRLNRNLLNAGVSL